jgi:hypothetical protein
VRARFFWLLLTFSLFGPAARPADKEQVFTAPNFDPTQIERVCIAPAIDLRPDKGIPLNLSGPDNPPKFDVFRGTSISGSVDGNLDRAFKTGVLTGPFKHLRYNTTKCAPVTATKDDLMAPSDTWIRELKSGDERWVFILAVEDLDMSNFTDRKQSTDLIQRTTFARQDFGHAVVSGYLIDKQSGQVVWRYRATGKAQPAAGGKISGLPLLTKNDSKHTELESRLAELAIRNGSHLLLEKFGACAHERCSFPVNNAN